MTHVSGLRHVPAPWWVEDRRGKLRNQGGGAIQVQGRHSGPTSSYCIAGVNEWESPIVNADLLSSAAAFAEVCGIDLEAGEQHDCGPLSWLRSALDALKTPMVRNVAEGDDPAAYDEMLAEVERLHAGLLAALAQAEGRGPSPTEPTQEPT